MATQFLRKIILEELQKVLKEDKWYKDPQFMGDRSPENIPYGTPAKYKSLTPDEIPYGTPGKYKTSKPKRNPLKKSFTEKEIVDLSLNPKRIYSGHKAQYKTASGEVYSIKFDRKGKPDYGTIALLYAPRSVASVSPDLSDKDVEGSVSFDPASESETDLKRVRGEIQPTFEESGLSRQEYDQCLALGTVRKCMQSKGIEPIDESITREINKLLKML